MDVFCSENIWIIEEINRKYLQGKPLGWACLFEEKSVPPSFESGECENVWNGCWYTLVIIYYKYKT
jgi:hypothetical protein